MGNRSKQSALSHPKEDERKDILSDVFEIENKANPSKTRVRTMIDFSYQALGFLGISNKESMDKATFNPNLLWAFASNREKEWIGAQSMNKGKVE